MNVVILAREGSSRYPGKHLHTIGGETLIAGIVRRIHEAGGRPVLCTGAYDDNRHIALATVGAGGDFYCEEIAPEWDLPSRMIGMARQLGIGYWLNYSGDCPFVDTSQFKPLWDRLVEGDVDRVGFETPYCAIGDMSVSAVSLRYWLKMHTYFSLDDQRREQPWVHFPAKDVVEATIPGRDRTATPVKTSIDWPLEGALADVIVRHLGRWPETDEEVLEAYRSIRALAVVDGEK